MVTLSTEYSNMPNTVQLILSAVLCTVCLGRNQYKVILNKEKSIHEVSERFLSVTLDFEIIRRGFDLYNLENVKLLTLTRALSPGILRLGGTAADFATFVPDGVFHDSVHSFSELRAVEEMEDHFGKKQHQFNMTGDQIDKILQFKLNTKMDLFIGLNVLKRRKDAWDPRNAKLLLDYIAERQVQVHWELGNEPPWRKFNVSVEPGQLSKDFFTLYNLKNSYPLFKDSYLAGPDMGQFRGKKYRMDFYDRFIRHTVPILNASTWHMYYTNGRTAALQDFINPELLDRLSTELHQFLKFTRNYSPTLPLWLGETSSTYGGGTPGLSDSFVAGFMWLDKLGLSAQEGLDLVIRQALFHGHYALLDNDFTPRPDYWLSLLYKVLVGRRVLDVELLSKSRSVRVYAHCVKNNATYDQGSFVIFALNLNNDKVELFIEDITSFDQFLLTPKNGELTSKTVLLNGEEIKMLDDQTLPAFKPVSIERIVLPALSFGFFVAKESKVTACLN